MYYYYQRWYDPTIGRFISPDPKHGRLSNPQSLNLYIYVLDQPTSIVDPSGEWGWNPFEAASNWWNGLSSDQRQFIVEAAVAVAVVAVVVATGGAALPVVLAAGVVGGAINVGITAGAKLSTGQQVSVSDLGHSFLQGFIVGAATAGVGSWISGARGASSAASTLESQSSRAIQYSSYFKNSGHLADIMEKFGIQEASQVDDFVNLTVNQGSVNSARSIFPRIASEAVFPAARGEGTYGLRVVWDVIKDEVFNAYPFEPPFPIPAFG